MIGEDNKININFNDGGITGISLHGQSLELDKLATKGGIEDGFGRYSEKISRESKGI